MERSLRQVTTKQREEEGGVEPQGEEEERKETRTRDWLAGQHEPDDAQWGVGGTQHEFQ